LPEWVQVFRNKFSRTDAEERCSEELRRSAREEKDVLSGKAEDESMRVFG
jgi:hypothetical protein